MTTKITRVTEEVVYITNDTLREIVPNINELSFEEVEEILQRYIDGKDLGELGTFYTCNERNNIEFNK